MLTIVLLNVLLCSPISVCYNQRNMLYNKELLKDLILDPFLFSIVPGIPIVFLIYPSNRLTYFLSTTINQVVVSLLPVI